MLSAHGAYESFFKLMHGGGGGKKQQLLAIVTTSSAVSKRIQSQQ